MSRQIGCELCESSGGEELLSTERWRLVLVADANYPGFCRVIWHQHVKEMTDLSFDARQELMAAVWAVESVLRTVMQPDKINLASFGNQVPHLHWHIIPRFADDAHFPNPIWSAAQAASADAAAFAQLQARHALLPALRAALLAHFNISINKY
jgi:diadenosine tetraphosphate (Ap4A) HIT family hydrolase